MSIIVMHKSRSEVRISSIRVFSDSQEAEARKYYESHTKGQTWHSMFGYRTSDTEEPKVIWSLAKDKAKK